MTKSAVLIGLVALAAISSACGGSDNGDELTTSTSSLKGVGKGGGSGHGVSGEALFTRATPTGNGRACVTCHRPEDDFGLTPATVEARWQALQLARQTDPDADDPLFRSIDADDFDQDFTTLRTKALIRVTLKLPPNVKLAADPSATTVSVWRAVPTIRNVAISGPYQHDGRFTTLEEQAINALRDHAEIKQDPAPEFLTKVADFQRSQFSSPSVALLAEAMAAGTTPLPDTDPPLDALETQGKTTFKEFCTPCHGTATQTEGEAPGVHKFLPPFNGTGVIPRGPNGQSIANIATTNPRPPAVFGFVPNDLPIQQFIVTLPNGDTVTVASSDPGDMLLSGNPVNANRFSIRQLRGVANTAPYFHDNSAPTLEAVIDHYQALFRLLGALGFPFVTTIPEAEIPGLLAYLQKI